MPGLDRTVASSHILDSFFFGDHFTTDQLRAVFTDEALLQSWLDAEASLAQAEASVGLVPADADRGDRPGGARHRLSRRDGRARG